MEKGNWLKLREKVKGENEIPIFIKWLVYAAFQIKTEEKTIYLDPRYR